MKKTLFLKRGLYASFGLVLLSLFAYQHTQAQNLITNGDFESGNGVGFTSNYNYITSGSSAQKNYSIVTNPQTFNASFNACTDHTSGSGKMMVVDGSFSNQDKIWEQSPGGGISVVQGKKYTFTYWIQTIGTGGNLADIEVKINNVTQTPTTGSTVAPSATCSWAKVTYEWTATSGSAQIWLYDKTTAAGGNDFAIDDLSLIGEPDPLTISYAVINPSCPDATDGYITVYAKGGTAPYTYSLNGGAYQSNSIFSGLAPSSNNFVSVKDATSPTPNEVSSAAVINVVAPVNDVTVRTDTTVCKGSPVQLSVAGGNAADYNWVASPADATLTSPTSATPTVSPAVTTTYTVTSNITTTQNLIYNPGFELGNIGFISDYTYYSVLPTRNRRSYGITKSPFDFDDLFAVTTDHSGTGYMMVVDGSEVNGGNDRVWTQTIPVKQNTTYNFKYWVQTVATPSPALLETQINGSPITGNASTSTYTCPAAIDGWRQVTYTWNSGSNNTATLTIYNRNTAGIGNDIAIDDMEFYTSSSCSLSKTVTVTVDQPAAKPNVTSPVNYCINAQATALSATGQNLKWYTTINGVGSTTAPIPVTTAAGQTTYYVTQDLGNTCGESEKESIVVNVIDSTPKPTVVSPVNYCINTPASSLSATGENLLWYLSLEGQGSSVVPTPSTTTAGQTTYYVSQNLGNVCGESQRESIIVTVVDKPGKPTVTSPVSYCINTTASQLSATGESLLWYTSLNGQGSSTAPTPSTTSVGQTTYYVTQNLGNVCGESDKESIIVNVVDKTPKPVVTSPISYCINSQASALTATGQSLLWYTAVNGQGSTTAPTPSTTSVGQTTYYVTQSAENACGESEKESIIVNVVDKTPKPVVTSPISYCINSQASALTATGQSLLWYTAVNGQGSTTAPTPSTTSVGQTTYYVTQSAENACGESDKESIIVNVVDKPSKPTVTSSVSYCLNSQAATLTASGSNLLWYTSINGQGSTTAPTPSTAAAGQTTYYVTQNLENVCGESDKESIVVNVVDKTAKPTVTSPVSYCQNATATALTATGTSLLWYTSLNGQGSTTAPTPATGTVGQTTYYVSQNLGTVCGESEKESIVVNITSTTPKPTVSSPVTYCQNSTAASLTATGSNLLWYTSLTGQGSVTAPTPSTGSAGTTTYYVSQNTGSCGESQREQLDVVVYANPSVNAGQDAEIALGSSATLSGQTNTIGSYLWTPSNLVDRPTELIATATPTSTTTFKLTVTDNETNCKASDEVTISIRPATPCTTLMPPNAFTPNNDGFYDLWNIGRPECVLKMQVDVYNIWGGQVYHSDDYKNDWDGRYKGKPLPDATYYYVIRVYYRDNSNKVLRGNVTILR